MNAKIKLLLVMALAASSAQAADERVDVRALPPAVQQTLEGLRKDGPVKQVTRQMVDGRNVYFVVIEKNNAPNPHLRIAEDGTLLRDPIPVVTPAGEAAPILTDEYGNPLGAFPKLSVTELPLAVQQTVRTEAAGREIADIDREKWRGQQVYEIEFKQRGLNSRIYVAEDGSLIRNERRPGEALRSLFMGTQLQDTPPPVQATIQRLAGGREIADIDRKVTGGQTVYRVELKSGEGNQELRISADGKLLYDSRATGEKRRG